ncbi:universal stress protein [Streptomyces sp. cg36]|uniref:universal stress protein n=1 Tax=Streptomyces sp. cg36 TaxID=3238798 RepID=UPI0034E2C893
MTAPAIERVVVGVDGSPGSLAALRQAADEARCHAAELWPVIAFTPPPGSTPDVLSPTAELWPMAAFTPLTDDTPGAPAPAYDGPRSRWVQQAHTRLTQACELVLGRAPEQVRLAPRVFCGQPADVLVSCACLPTDLLVMGASSHGPLHHALFGSVARRCLREAHCPVLVVRPNERVTAAGDDGSNVCAAGAPHPRLIVPLDGQDLWEWRG